MDTPYTPVDCGFHDRLESLAVRGVPCQVVLRSPEGQARTLTARVLDVFAEGDEEFARFGGGLRVRLDQIDALDGVPRPAATAPAARRR